MKVGGHLYNSIGQELTPKRLQHNLKAVFGELPRNKVV